MGNTLLRRLKPNATAPKSDQAATAKKNPPKKKNKVQTRREGDLTVEIRDNIITHTVQLPKPPPPAALKSPATTPATATSQAPAVVNVAEGVTAGDGKAAAGKEGEVKKVAEAGAADGGEVGYVGGFVKGMWYHKGQPFTALRMESIGAKRLSGGRHSNSVWLLPGGIVEKRYGTGDTRKERMDLEIEILSNKLKHCPFVPKILGTDLKNRIVWLTYCGKSVTESLEKRTELDKLLRTLEDQYGVYRPENTGKKLYIIQNQNVTRLGNQLYIIDFASKNWQTKNI